MNALTRPAARADPPAGLDYPTLDSGPECAADARDPSRM